MAPQALKLEQGDGVGEDKQTEVMDKININNKKSGIGSGPRKVCGVCGDKAYGYNFNALTCESCKAFFRRNALASKKFKCSFDDECTITVVTRRFCQKCRLNKCFAIGMDKHYIMSDEDKAQKRLKIAENKAKKRQKDHSGDDEVIVTSSKIIKREDNEDSNNSWIVCDKDQLSVPYEGYNQSESPENLIQNGDRSSPIVGNNKPVSVIKNSNDEVSDLTSKRPNVDYECYIDSIQHSEVPLNYDTNFIQDVNLMQLNNHIVSNGSEVMSPDHQQFVKFVNSSGMVVEGRQLSEDENVMIRSMLTAPTPNSELPKAHSTSFTEPQMCDSALNFTRVSAPSKADVARDVLQDVESIHRPPAASHSSIENILCEAIKLEFEAYTSLAQINSSSRELNDAERAKLNELIVANKALSTPLDEDHVVSLVSDEYRFKPAQGQNNLLGIINLTAIAIRRLIKMSKKINAFKNMCEEDQVALLKGGCTEMMILRSTMTYDCARDTWKIPHSQESMSSIKADVLKLAKGNVYEEHDRFIRTFDPRWRMDENIILIMCAIVLFTPDRPRVVHSDVIKLEQNSYYYLLRRYLESIYPGCEAKSTFLKLIQKIMELHKLADDVIEIYLDVNPSHVEPLLIEIFDLKQQH